MPAEPTEAEARLIAAAPELLAACEAAAWWFSEGYHESLADTLAVREKLAQALAKARGETPR
jgi:hypothetical protein